MPAQAILLYEQPKRRKTSLMIGAFPNGLFLGRSADIKAVAMAEYGFEPVTGEDVGYAEPRTLVDVQNIVQSLHETGTLAGFEALVVNDWSLLAKAAMGDWEDQEAEVAALKSKAEKREVGLNIGRIYGAYIDTQNRILSRCISLGVHFGVVCHVREPKDGIPGFPDVPSRNQGRNLPAWFDIVARVVPDKSMPDPSCPLALTADADDANWVTNDRSGVIRPKAPANLREVLRARRNPVVTSRIEGLEWQDEVADEIAAELQAGVAVGEIVAARFPQGVPDPPESAEEAHSRWALQDGMARGVLRVRKSRRLTAKVAVRQ